MTLIPTHLPHPAPALADSLQAEAAGPLDTRTYPLAEGLFLEITTVPDPPDLAGPVEVSVALWGDGHTLRPLPGPLSPDRPAWDVLALLRLALEPAASAAPALRFQVLLPGSQQQVCSLRLGRDPLASESV